MAVNDIVMGAAGASGPATYIEDVFSTYLYTGNGSTQTITNGIDLAGKGGMTWIKQRNSTGFHRLLDTLRGVDRPLFSNATNASPTQTELQSFNADGFTVTGANTNAAFNYVSWTFREQPKFFDIVTYTGNGAGNQDVAHNLGSTPGCIIVKKTSATGNWIVYHRGISGGNNLRLNTTDSASAFGSPDPLSLNGAALFSVGAGPTADDNLNDSGSTYVAYLFAHDAGGFGANGTDNVISCGSYTGTGGSNTITLGYEPQWLLIKETTVGDANSYWAMEDVMRGGINANGTVKQLRANSSASEDTLGATTNGPRATATGFQYSSAGSLGAYNRNGSNYVYIAIRRPMTTPTTGTEVFYAGTGNGSATIPAFVTNFTVDMGINRLYRTSSTDNYCISRLTGNQYTRTNLTNAEGGPETDFVWDSNIGYVKGNFGGAGGYTQAFAWAFKRAPGFFDEVCYTGTGVARTVNHNLGVVPELMIVKGRSSTNNWIVYSSFTGNTQGLVLNGTNAPVTTINWWNNTSPTSSVFTVGIADATNLSGATLVAYLFATVANVSKVGSYTGNGSTQTINCGFTTGARFVMIKRTDSTGDWKVIDTARGIVAGNDPTLALNTTAAEVTGTDCIDPDSSGFIVNQETTNNLNVNAATYIFLAIS